MNELTKLMFKELKVEPNEEFKLNGFEERFRISEDLNIYLYKNTVWWIVRNFSIIDLITRKYEILKLPKKLLTEEENQFLKHYTFKFIEIFEDGYLIINYGDNGENQINLVQLDMKFKELEFNKKYTPKELGL